MSRIILKIVKKFDSVKWQTFWYRLLKISLSQMNYGNGSSPIESGEKNVIQYIQTKLSESNNITVFDVGANKGQYVSMLVNTLSKKADIYCFEPSNNSFKALDKIVQNLGNIKHKVNIYNFGFSNKIDSLPLHCNEHGSEFSSVYNLSTTGREFNVFNAYEIAKFDTIDNFCSQNKIVDISFLKIDIEGHELYCLKGAAEVLSKLQVKYIQFEFGSCNIDSKTYFRDLYELLSPNYKIYRVLRHELFLIEKYELFNEVFITTNYLAELKPDISL